MKKIFVIVVLLFSLSESWAAINCATPPTCESLGYEDEVNFCPNKAIKCPFDSAKGICVEEAEPGDIKYSLKNANHNGWMKLDGSVTLSKNQFPDLYAVIGNNFGGSGDEFKLPNYSGYFLRVRGTSMSTNSSMNVPQMNGLPDIAGSVGQMLGWGKMPIATVVGPTVSSFSASGALYYTNYSRMHSEFSPIANAMIAANKYYPYEGKLRFMASNFSSVYGSYGLNQSNGTPMTGNASYVIPRNYAVNAFMYVGKSAINGSNIVNCTHKLYYFGTYGCSSVNLSGKPLYGVVGSITKYSDHIKIGYIYGGSMSATRATAVAQCEKDGATLATLGKVQNVIGVRTLSPFNNVVSGSYYWTANDANYLYKCSGDKCSITTASGSGYFYCQKDAVLYF